MGLILKQASSGKIIEGNNDGDALVWNATTREWEPGSGGGSIPDGSYDGQPIKWDGASYVPLPLGNSLFCAGVGFPADSGYVGLFISPDPSGGCFLTAPVDTGTISLQADGPNGTLNLASTTLSVFQAGSGGMVSLRVLPGARIELTTEHLFFVDESGEDIEVLRMANIGAAPGLGVFGAEPVGIRSITGATAQQQIDSIVAALVTLGFAADNR